MTSTRTEAHVVQITKDHGGQIYTYLDEVYKAKKRGDEFHILGKCYSACTIYLQATTCVGPEADIRFHRPRLSPQDRAQVPSDRINQLEDHHRDNMMKFYPGIVKSWIKQNGGLTDEILVMPNEVAVKFFGSCAD